VGDLAQALKELFGKPEQETRVIGTRHGEKLYESLISREEMAHAIDMGGYYRIPADNRDLNYAKYFNEGETDISTLDDYTSHNTHRLNVDKVKSLLLTLDYIKEELDA
jgi:UDP-glucose 4-epimerase